MSIVIDELSDERDDYINGRSTNRYGEQWIDISLSEISRLSKPAEQAVKNSLTTLNTANAIKVQIQEVGGDTGLLTTRYGLSTANISSQYGSIISGVATATGASLGIVGLGTVVIAYGTINYDILMSYHYPKVTNLDVSNDDVWDGEGFSVVTESNAGFGVSTRLFKNSGSQIGFVFDINSPTVNVSTLISQYNSGISSIANQNILASEIQKQKTEEELQLWGLRRDVEFNNQRVSEYNSIIGIASDPTTGGPW